MAAAETVMAAVETVTEAAVETGMAVVAAAATEADVTVTAVATGMAVTAVMAAVAEVADTEVDAAVAAAATSATTRAHPPPHYQRKFPTLSPSPSYLVFLRLL